MSERIDDEETYQNMQDGNTGITIKKILPPSPKTRMIEMMEEEEEEQQRALDQIEDCYEETRPWLVDPVGMYNCLLWQSRMCRAY